MNLAQIFPYTAFTETALAGLWPFIVLGIGGTLTLISAPLKNGHGLSRALALLTFLITAVLFWSHLSSPNETVGGVLVLGTKASALNLILLITGAFTLFLLSGMEKNDKLLPEANALVVYAVLGMGLLVTSHHLLFQFISIEIMSLAVYVLVSLRRTHRPSAEAGMKYFILGGLASATFLYGAALIYGATGAFTLPEIAAAPESMLKTAGFILVTGGLLFKVGAVPFHSWVPDVYEGATLPVTGFMAAAVKFAAFTVLAGLAASATGATTATAVTWMLTIAAGLTMAWGNFAAITQKGLKRLLAYSSIAHTGYLLIGVISSGAQGNQGPVSLYLLFYAFATLGAFSTLQALTPGSEDIPIDSLAGRGLSHPFLGAALTVFLFGMAGIPLTAGFIGKYLVFGAGVNAGHVPLVVLGVLTSVAAVYYYLRIVVALYMKPVEASAPRPALHWGAAVVTLLCLLSTLYYGVLPTRIISYFGSF